MKSEKIIERIWGNLEGLQEQMVSSHAENLTLEELSWVDARISEIMEKTKVWFKSSAP